MKQPDALMFSLATEVPLVLAVGWRWADDWRRLAMAAAAATLLTHPFAWWSFRILHPHIASFPIRALIIEVTVALLEATLFAKLLNMTWKHALILGFLANAFSFGLGVFVSRM